MMTFSQRLAFNLAKFIITLALMVAALWLFMVLWLSIPPQWFGGQP